MLDTHMDRRDTLFQILLCWALIGLCLGGHRAHERGERPRLGRHHDRRAQRIEFPSPNDQGVQRVEFPSMNDEGAAGYPSPNSRGQRIQYPSVNDDATSSQIQKCAPGFYRKSSWFSLSRCVPCECNGLADECEDNTGRCLNCQYNTIGDRCERCKEGYYGNAAQRTCKICPCPFSVPTNSFAEGCREESQGFKCFCKPGYTGDKCERCAPGYYGDPLSPGGSCQPCKCNGNGNNCDSRTGVCKNTLEPGDTNTDEHCQECDNCAQTLLNDLEKLDDELVRIKNQLDNASASASSLDRLKKLEKAIADTKIHVNKFTTTINAEKPKVTQLEADTVTLADDINTLKDKADKNSDDANKAVEEVDETHERAKNLDSEIQNLLKKIKALVDRVDDSPRGDTVTNENLAKMLEEAERLVMEMEKRNFTPQKTAAEKERDEAKKLLENIKNNVAKQCDQNEAAAKKIQDLLKNHQDRLKELDEALKDAADLVKRANTQNGLNDQALKDLQKRIDDLKKEKKIVEGQMKMAEDELKKTKDLVKTLTDSKTEYEKLAAQLDGAKTDLTKKVNDIVKAAAQEDIVERAEEHAKNLAKLAKDIEDAVKNASGRSEVKNAKDAIDAYKNIADAINAAKAAANDAKKAADNALDNVQNQKLTERAKDLKETADELLQNAKESDNGLKDASDDLADVKKRLSDAEKKKAALKKDLQDAQNELNNIQKDNIADTIDDAKTKAAAANNTASDTMNRLNDIKNELNKIKVPAGGPNMDGVLDDVDKSVKDLLSTIPSLNDKISEVESLTSQFQPINNITENIKKIKELIEQARDAANRIVVPMKFSGDGYVEMRAPKNLEDLKAYTSVSLSLQRPEGRGDGRRRRRQISDKDMFVMYLGSKDSSKNYIGMAVRNNVLYGFYKLNGVEYELRTTPITMSASEPAKFDKVDLRRIYQDAEMIVTKDSTSDTNSVIKQSVQGEQKQNLLDLSPSDVVFYVGGYPDDFTPPASLNFPKYKGCIEFSSFNDKVVSLYNFEKAEKINEVLPCKRYVPPMDSEYYEGTGYSKGVIERPVSVLVFSISIHTRSENGLLLYVGSEEKYFSVSMEKGAVVIQSSLLSEPVKSTSKIFPTTDWETFTIIKSNDKVTVRTTKGNVEAPVNYMARDIKEYYFGGAPSDMRENHKINIQPFKGCVRNLKQNGNVIVPAEQVGVSKGCPTDSLMTRKAEFSLGSSLSADLAGFSLAGDVTVSLGFKSSEDQGLILQNKQPGDTINLALEDGRVVLILNNKIWKSNKQYNDGQWHYLTVTKRAGGITLMIDDEDEGQEQSGNTSIAATAGTLFLGKNKFEGCIGNLYTRRPEKLFKVEDFSSFTTSGDVFLDVCSADSPAQLMLDRTSRKR